MLGSVRACRRRAGVPIRCQPHHSSDHLTLTSGAPLHAVKHVDFSGRAFALWVSDVSLVHRVACIVCSSALVLFGGSDLLA